MAIITVCFQVMHMQQCSPSVLPCGFQFAFTLYVWWPQCWPYCSLLAVSCLGFRQLMAGAGSSSVMQHTWAGWAQVAINQTCRILSLSCPDLLTDVICFYFVFHIHTLTQTLRTYWLDWSKPFALFTDFVWSPSFVTAASLWQMIYVHNRCSAVPGWHQSWAHRR